jgi:hypothetical protein
VFEKPGTPKGNRTPVCAVKGRSKQKTITRGIVRAALLMDFLAGSHVAPFGQFQIGVGEIPKKQRRDGVRYGYLVNSDGSLQRLG